LVFFFFWFFFFFFPPIGKKNPPPPLYPIQKVGGEKHKKKTKPQKILQKGTGPKKVGGGKTFPKSGWVGGLKKKQKKKKPQNR